MIKKIKGSLRSHSQGQSQERYSKRKSHYDRVPNSKDPRNQFEEITFKSITINTIKPVQVEVFVTVKVDLDRRDCSTLLEAKLDTAAQGNILPIRLYRQMYPQHVMSDGLPKSGSLQCSKTVLTVYGAARLWQYRTCKIPCEFKGKHSEALFYVTEAEGPAIIGLPTLLELDMIILDTVKKSD